MEWVWYILALDKLNVPPEGIGVSFELHRSFFLVFLQKIVTSGIFSQRFILLEILRQTVNFQEKRVDNNKKLVI